MWIFFVLKKDVPRIWESELVGKYVVNVIYSFCQIGCILNADTCWWSLMVTNPIHHKLLCTKNMYKIQYKRLLFQIINANNYENMQWRPNISSCGVLVVQELFYSLHIQMIYRLLFE